MTTLSIIKLGGAAITRADGPDGLDTGVAMRLARELHELEDTRLILIHGTGAVGKPPAIEHGYADKGVLPPATAALSCEIHRRIRGLNQRLVEVLLQAGIPALGIDPALLISPDFEGFRGDEARSFLADLVRHGVVPVIYGDMVPQPNGDFRVLSSDVIACVLARELRADHLVFLSNVNGVLESAALGEKSPVMAEIRNEDLSNPGLFGASDGEDVSGGMGAKMRMALAASAHCGKCWLGSGLTPGVLPQFFRHGIITGTLINGKQ